MLAQESWKSTNIWRDNIKARVDPGEFPKQERRRGLLLLLHLIEINWTATHIHPDSNFHHTECVFSFSLCILLSVFDLCLPFSPCTCVSAAACEALHILGEVLSPDIMYKSRLGNSYGHSVIHNFPCNFQAHLSLKWSKFVKPEKTDAPCTAALSSLLPHPLPWPQFGLHNQITT